MGKSVIALSLLLTGCFQHIDYYTQVKDVCSFFPTMAYQRPDGEYTTLTPECFDRLSAIVPFDSSFDSAPANMRLKILEGFQALIGYPLALPPENKILGASPYSIPQSIVRDFAYAENPNKAAFNYVLNQFDQISYGGVGPTGISGNYLIKPDMTGKLTVFYHFFENAYVDRAFMKAQFLVHEARHGDGVWHVSCAAPDGSTVDCDQDLNGAYGIGASYLELVLHGSKASLTEYQRRLIALEICYSIKIHVRMLPSELGDLLNGTECSAIDTAWISQHEGI